MKKTVNMMEGSYEKAVSYRKKQDNGKSGWSVEKIERIERRELLLVYDWITITMKFVE